MSAEEAKAIVDRFWDEVWNKKNLGIADELLADDVIVHNFATVVQGREAWRQSFAPFFTGFPDLTFTVEFTVSQGDRTVVRWMATGTHTGDFRNIAPTGKQIRIAGVAIYRVEGGKIVEGWSQPDTLGLIQQLGVLPPPSQSG